MFIKIKNHSPYNEEDSFTIIDNIDVINYFCPKPKEVMSTEEAKKLWNGLVLNIYEGDVVDSEWLYLVNQDKADKSELPTAANPYRYNIINFHRKDSDDDVDEQWIFDTVAYIMSDEGRTIEKVMAGGLSSKILEKAFLLSETLEVK